MTYHNNVPIIIYVLPIVEAEDAPSHYKTKAQMNERLEWLISHWSTYLEGNLAHIDPIDKTEDINIEHEIILDVMIY